MSTTKIRVNQLARELGMESKELVDFLQKEGFDSVKSHSSTLDEEEAELIRKQIYNARKEAQEARRGGPKPAPAPAPQPQEEGGQEAQPEENGNEIHLKTPITVRDLATALKLKPNELIIQLMHLNIFAAINQVLETETVEKLCERNGKKFVQERREKGNHPVFEIV